MSDIQTVVDAMNKKGFEAQIARDAEEARNMVLAIIGEDESVGVGGSMTLEETGIFDALVARGNTMFSSTLAKRKGEDKDQARQDGMNADVYLSSTNAVTMAGDLINIDGVGNRVAGMFYGPSKVVIVSGKNKITANPMTAVTRIKTVSCPQNARRLGRSTPCALTGKCGDCDDPAERMCNVTTRIQRPTVGKQIYMVLIDGDFGY